MRIHSWHIHLLHIPLTQSWDDSERIREKSEQLVLEIRTHSGASGYGEVHLDNLQEERDTVLHDINRLCHFLAERSFFDLARIEHFSMKEAPSRACFPAICAVEMALLDVYGKVHEMSLLAALGKQIPDQIMMGLELPLMRDIHDTSSFRKLSTLQPLRLGMNGRIPMRKLWQLTHSIRRIHPHALPFSIHAHGSWNLARALHQIPRLWQMGIHDFVDPFSTSNQASWTILHAHWRKKVRLIHSLPADVPAARRVIRSGSCHAIRLNLSRNGGIFRCVQYAQAAHKAGLSVHLETPATASAIYTAATLLFSAMSPGIAWHWGSWGTLLLEHDLSYFPLQIQKGGLLDHPGRQMAGYGLGVKVESEMLKAYATPPVRQEHS